jgi:hypothetical protein
MVRVLLDVVSEDQFILQGLEEIFILADCDVINWVVRIRCGHAVALHPEAVPV